ncbi:hypothetical protein ABZX85_23830 [Streptomyces sp. NPDC004539]|uniref:hypothetical protein n=1 Tax=Streptomyces sp. NPDC004539 TaxID=3154280 RepID=UPI0033B8A921
MPTNLVQNHPETAAEELAQPLEKAAHEPHHHGAATGPGTGWFPGFPHAKTHLRPPPTHGEPDNSLTPESRRAADRRAAAAGPDSTGTAYALNSSPTHRPTRLTDSDRPSHRATESSTPRIRRQGTYT